MKSDGENFQELVQRLIQNEDDETYDKLKELEKIDQLRTERKKIIVQSLEKKRFGHYSDNTINKNIDLSLALAKDRRQ